MVIAVNPGRVPVSARLLLGWDIGVAVYRVAVYPWGAVLQPEPSRAWWVVKRALTGILSPRITVIGMSPVNADDAGRGLKARGPRRHCPGPCVVPPPWGQELALDREARKLPPERKLGWQEFIRW